MEQYNEKIGTRKDLVSSRIQTSSEIKIVISYRDGKI